MSYRNLFSSGKIGTMILHSRAIFPPMATRMAEPDYTVGSRLIAYHAARAQGGCPLNMTEFTAVHPSSHFPCTPALYDDKFIPGMSALADALHQKGGKLCVQLWHAGRQATKELTGGFELIAPSEIPLAAGWETPHALTVQEISDLVEAFGMAAQRAKTAGADAVEIHGAHGYLIGQFLSGWSNHRGDTYGGSLENRARFALEIIQRVRQGVGKDFPVIFRFSAEERIPAPNAMTPEQAVEIARLAERAGVDALHVSIGGYCAMWDMIPPIELAPGFNVHNATLVKKAVRIPVIAVGRINDPALAEKILAEGSADFVSIGRAQLADPEFLNKARAGQADQIHKCIACNQGCIGRYGNSPNGKHLTCLRNPLCGHEFLPHPQAPDQRLTVLVAGGGVGGLEAARFLGEQGHRVILCEKESNCGGQFLLAGVPPKKREIADAMEQIYRGAKAAGIEIRTNTQVDRALLQEIKPDFFVIAVGASPIVPRIPGADDAVLAQDVLSGTVSVGKRVVILGGGLVGIETAEYLHALGKDVTVVEMLDCISPKADVYKRHFIDEFLRESGIAVHLRTKCTEVAPGLVRAKNADGAELVLAVDSVVIAAGYRSQTELAEIAADCGIAYKVIGDAKEPRLAIDAISEAFQCAISL